MEFFSPNPKQPRPKPAQSLHEELKRDLKIILLVLFCAFLVSLIALAILAGLHVFMKGYALCFWALACSVVGLLFGFLFGIPRVLQKNSADNPPAETGADKNRRSPQSNYQLLVNTNLDDISDWLTKIVLGVSLIELQKMPGLLRHLAEMIAAEMGDNQLTLFIIAVIIYFAIVGFMTGYFATRLFVQRAFYIADLYTGGGSEMEATMEQETTISRLTVTTTPGNGGDDKKADALN